MAREKVATGRPFEQRVLHGAGIVASLTHIVLSGPADTIPSVGASGAIAGVLGTYLVLFPRRRIHVLLPGFYFRTGQVSALVMLGFWFLLQFLAGIGALTAGTAQTSGVAVWAHIGGFVAGAVIGLLVRGMGGGALRTSSID